MKYACRLLAIFLAAAMLATPALAVVRPSEVLANPVLEARARSLSQNLRCMVCQNQSIDDSDSELAHDLRVLVRERLMAGDSDRQVIDYVVSRYGEFVLLKPRLSMRNAALWATPVVILLLGALYLFAARRRRTTAALSLEEKAELDRILAPRVEPES